MKQITHCTYWILENIYRMKSFSTDISAFSCLQIHNCPLPVTVQKEAPEGKQHITFCGFNVCFCLLGNWSSRKFAHNALSVTRSLGNTNWNVILSKSQDNISEHHKICYVMKYVSMFRNNRFSTACEVMMYTVILLKNVFNYMFSFNCIKYYSLDTSMKISGFS